MVTSHQSCGAGEAAEVLPGCLETTPRPYTHVTLLWSEVLCPTCAWLKASTVACPALSCQHPGMGSRSGILQQPISNPKILHVQCMSCAAWTPHLYADRSTLTWLHLIASQVPQLHHSSLCCCLACCRRKAQCRVELLPSVLEGRHLVWHQVEVAYDGDPEVLQTPVAT